jgi:serine/threonine protein kinase
MSSADKEIAPGTVIARYTVARRIGGGQMGEVYEAHRTGGSGSVAIKVVRGGSYQTTEHLRRFDREAAICAKIRHPNVVPVVDFGAFEGTPFLVMPVLRGSDLERLLERTGPLAPEVAVAVALACGRGLGAAHDAAVVHRDFKPANVFLDEGDDGTITPIVCDFGVAKALLDEQGGALTATGAVIGTPLYMAPEQLLDSKHVDARCDVWALGMTLYHMLTGRTAFQDIASFGELLLAMREGRIAPVQTHAPWVPPTTARIVHAMLLPQEDRIRSIADAVHELEREAAPPKLVRELLVSLTPEQKAVVAVAANLPKRAGELVIAPLESSPLAASLVSDPLIGTLLGDRFQIVGRLGTGGMGAVYEALDTSPAAKTKDVAIKVMQGGEQDPEGRRRFLREAKAASRVVSPYVATTIDSGVDAKSGSPYIVMERLRGRDLGNHLRREGALSPAPVLRLFLDACNALAAAHALGIVHRDVKPSNLFVHEIGDGSVVLKVCDFGIAKQLADSGVTEATADLTRTGGLLGSPLYMSPEQAKSAKNVDARSDVFSLSLSLHEALSGLRPWEGRSSMGEIIVAICTEDPPPLEKVAPWLPPELVRAIQRGLARDANARLQTVQELADAIRLFALDRAVRVEDLVGIASDRRAPAAGWSVASSARGATGQPISVTASDFRGNAPKESKRSARVALIGGLVLLGVVAGGAAAFRGRSAGATADPPPVLAKEPVTAATPPPTSTDSVVDASVPDAVAATVDAGRGSPPHTGGSIKALPRPPAQPSAEPAPSASASASASSKPFGRGRTAPDLPP